MMMMMMMIIIITIILIIIIIIIIILIITTLNRVCENQGLPVPFLSLPVQSALGPVRGFLAGPYAAHRAL